MTLAELGKRTQAIEIYSKMLELNENDNMGVRYVLLPLLAAENKFSEAEKFLTQWSENTAQMLYAKVLLYFKQGDEAKANATLKKAQSANKHVPKFLLSQKKLKEVDSYSHGGEDEAAIIQQDTLTYWQETKGALEWLRANA